MSDELQKKIFSRNLLRLVSNSQKSQKEIADAIGVSPQTFNTWCQGIAIPRMGKIQALADYFHVKKTTLLDDAQPSDNTSPRVRSVARNLNELSDDQLDIIDVMIKSFIQNKKE